MAESVCAILLAQAESVCDILLAQARDTFGTDVPELLSLSSQALKRAPFPGSIDEALKLSRDQIFQLVPVACAVCSAVGIALLMLNAGKNRHVITAQNVSKHSYWLTRVLLLRGMALCYLAGFSTSAFQARALFGSLGLQPASFSARVRPTPAFDFLERSHWGPKLQLGDWALDAVSWAGVMLSLLLLTSAFTTALLPAALWALYLSLVNLGGWTSNYGWEWLTLELGFLSIFLCPLLTVWRSPFPERVPPPPLVLFLFRWCAFRLLIGAGMSKLGRNSSKCWKELTCTTTHYFTQPMPNPLAWYAHHLPPSVHQFEVLLTFFEQLVLPFLLLVPVRAVRVLAGWLALLFQVGIVASGNYAWINFIGALPSLACFDDHALRLVFSTAAVSAAKKGAQIEAGLCTDDSRHSSLQQVGVLPRLATTLRSACNMGGSYMRAFVYTLLVCFILSKSASPLKELFTAAPWLHYYDDYFFVNAQGVFGFINSHRPMLVLSYTHDALPELDQHEDSCVDHEGFIANDQNGRALTCADIAPYCAHNEQLSSVCPRTCGTCQASSAVLFSDSLNWQVLEWSNLPGETTKMPWFNSPYHRRLDWEVWIHTTASTEERALAGHRLTIPPFIRTLAAKVLAGDTEKLDLLGSSVYEVLGLVQGNISNAQASPEAASHPSVQGPRAHIPTAIKAEWWWYTFSKPPKPGKTQKHWWGRKRIANNEATLWTKARDASAGPVRRLPPQRSWMLTASLCGFLWSFHLLLTALLGPTIPPLATRGEERGHERKKKLRRARKADADIQDNHDGVAYDRNYGATYPANICVATRFRLLLFGLVSALFFLGIFVCVFAATYSWTRHGNRFALETYLESYVQVALAFLNPLLPTSFQLNGVGKLRRISDAPDVCVYSSVFLLSSKMASACLAYVLLVAILQRRLPHYVLFLGVLSGVLCFLARDAAHLQLLLDRL